MKIAYIAHPIGGDVQGNLRKVAAIVRQVNLKELEIIPFAPYYADCMALDDAIPEDRARGIKNNKEHFVRGIMDELRLYGDRVSAGMIEEIKLAKDLGIPIKPMTEETVVWFEEYKNE